MNCYGKDPYEVKMEKQALIKKGMHLLNSKCCDEDCDVLIKDVEKTAEDCHDLFRNMHELDGLDLDGKILTDSLCSDLEEKKTKLQETRIKSLNTAKAEGVFKKGRVKRTSRRKKTSRRKRTSRRKSKSRKPKNIKN